MPAREEGVGERFADVDRHAVERLSFFSDAVVAIAITLLAIDLPVPKGETSRAFLDSLVDNKFDYLSFLISFAVIGSHWGAHHRVFRWLVAVSRPLMTTNLVWLLLVVLTPFLTEVLREGQRNVAKFGLYACAQAMLILLFGLMEAVATRGRLFDPRTPAAVTEESWWHACGNASGFVVSVPLYPLIGSWGVVLWVGIPLVERRVTTRLLALRSRRRRTHHTEEARRVPPDAP